VIDVNQEMNGGWCSGAAGSPAGDPAGTEIAASSERKRLTLVKKRMFAGALVHQGLRQPAEDPGWDGGDIFKKK